MVLPCDAGIVLHTITLTDCLPSIDSVIVIVSDVSSVSFVVEFTHL